MKVMYESGLIVFLLLEGVGFTLFLADSLVDDLKKMYFEIYWFRLFLFRIIYFFLGLDVRSP